MVKYQIWLLVSLLILFKLLFFAEIVNACDEWTENGIIYRSWDPYECWFLEDTDRYKSAQFLAEKWIIKNQSLNIENYNIDSPILRQEMALIIMRMSWIEENQTCKWYFKDVSLENPNNWSCTVIESLYDDWILSKNDNFNPEYNIKETEAMALITRLLYPEYSYNAEYVATWGEQLEKFLINKWIIESFNNYEKIATRWYIFDNAMKVLESIDNTSSFDIYNPENCIEAKSQCNDCFKEEWENYMICTEMVCNNEVFRCIEYK